MSWANLHSEPGNYEQLQHHYFGEMNMQGMNGKKCSYVSFSAAEKDRGVKAKCFREKDTVAFEKEQEGGRWHNAVILVARKGHLKWTKSAKFWTSSEETPQPTQIFYLYPSIYIFSLPDTGRFYLSVFHQMWLTLQWLIGSATSNIFCLQTRREKMPSGTLWLYELSL